MQSKRPNMNTFNSAVQKREIGLSTRRSPVDILITLPVETLRSQPARTMYMHPIYRMVTRRESGFNKAYVRPEYPIPDARQSYMASTARPFASYLPVLSTPTSAYCLHQRQMPPSLSEYTDSNKSAAATTSQDDRSPKVTDQVLRYTACS